MRYLERLICGFLYFYHLFYGCGSLIAVCSVVGRKQQSVVIAYADCIFDLLRSQARIIFYAERNPAGSFFKVLSHIFPDLVPHSLVSFFIVFKTKHGVPVIVISCHDRIVDRAASEPFHHGFKLSDRLVHNAAVASDGRGDSLSGHHLCDHPLVSFADFFFMHVDVDKPWRNYLPGSVDDLLCLRLITAYVGYLFSCDTDVCFF